MVVIGFRPSSMARVFGEPKYMLGDLSSLEYLNAHISSPLVKAQEMRMGSSEWYLPMMLVTSRKVA